jgi:hypothetical protein
MRAAVGREQVANTSIKVGISQLDISECTVFHRILKYIPFLRFDLSP